MKSTLTMASLTTMPTRTMQPVRLIRFTVWPVTHSTSATPAAVPGPSEGAPTRLSPADEDAVRQRIRQCWNVDPNALQTGDMVVEVRVVMRPDRTVETASVVDEARLSRDSGFRAAAEAARRAVLNPRCQPLPLPPDGYRQWRDLVLVFDPRDMF